MVGRACCSQDTGWFSVARARASWGISVPAYPPSPTRRITAPSGSICVRLISSSSLHRMFFQSLPSWWPVFHLPGHYKQKPRCHPESNLSFTPHQQSLGLLPKFCPLYLIAAILVQAAHHYCFPGSLPKPPCCSPTPSCLTSIFHTRSATVILIFQSHKNPFNDFPFPLGYDKNS